MADIELVIKINEKQYEHVKNIGALWIEKEGLPIVTKALLNGTPLPKRHGDLIDRSKIYKAIPAEEDNCAGMGMTLEEMDAYNDGIDAMYLCIKGAPTIIKADNESEE